MSCAGVQFVVLKRYSDFQTLHKRLLAAGLAARVGTSGTFPSLPPKRSWRTQHEAFAEVRRLELQGYLQLLVLEPEIRSTQEIHAFLELGLLLRRDLEGGTASSSMSHPNWGSPPAQRLSGGAS